MKIKVANIDKLWERSINELLAMYEKGELSNSDKIRIASELLKNYYPLLRAREIMSTQNTSTFDKLSELLNN